MTTLSGRVVIQIVAALLLAIFPAALSGQRQQGGWQGLIPLRSTRMAVEARLGKSSDACNCRYENANEAVVIDYAKGPCKGPPHGWNVPAGTVLQITLYPKTKRQIAQLGLIEKEYETSHGVDGAAVYYANVREGIKYSVQAGEVHSISYFPSGRDLSRRCQGFPPYDGGVREYQPYAAFSAKAQMIEERLGEFGGQLANNEKLKGFIVTYAGKVARRGEAKLMAEKAKRDLSRITGINPNRIVLVDGGFRETAEYELFLLAAELPQPTATPTLSSNQVKILPVRTQRRKKPVD